MSTQEKKLKSVNKNYQCVDGVIVPRTKSLAQASSRGPTAWTSHLGAFYKEKKAQDPSYSYKQAMKDARGSYTPVAKPVKAPKVKVPKAPKPPKAPKQVITLSMRKAIKDAKKAPKKKATSMQKAMMEMARDAS
jgi:hypothetical protein